MPKKHSPAIKREAMRLYYLRVPHAQIVKKLHVPKDTFLSWVKENNWTEQRQKVEDEADEIVRRQCQDIILLNKQKVMLEDLDISSLLKRSIKDNLQDESGKIRNIKARDLDSLAKAAKNSSDIATRIVGLGAEQQNNKAASMTVNIGIQGVMPQAHAQSIHADYIIEDDPFA